MSHKDCIIAEKEALLIEKDKHMAKRDEDNTANLVPK